MKWLDVMGAPGSGKSTICDAFWGPHALQIEHRYPPARWEPFLNEIDRLFCLIRSHPTFEAALRMNNRSIRKVSTVARDSSPGPYIQTCLAQRGLGFGWRMVDLGVPIDQLCRYFELMPVSIGVAVTRCPTAVVEARNHARKLVKATAHEDRAHMVTLMLPAIEVAIEVLNGRGVPVLEVSTDQQVEASRKEIRAFSMRQPFDDEAAGRGCEVEVLQAPSFWLGPGFRKSVPPTNNGSERPEDVKWYPY